MEDVRKKLIDLRNVLESKSLKTKGGRNEWKIAINKINLYGACDRVVTANSVLCPNFKNGRCSQLIVYCLNAYIVFIAYES